MKIHGFVYVVLGILMSLYARFIQSKVQKSSLSLFFWIGIGFLVFGIFRLITSYVFGDKTRKEESASKVNPRLEALRLEKERIMSRSNSESNSNFDVNNPQNDSREIVECPRCLTRHYSNSRFCHMCGSSLK
jgi:hypothetical protein